MAEEAGLAAPIGQWALREACRQLRSWQIQRGVADDLSINVNVVGGRILDQGLVAEVTGILRDTGSDGRNIGLEITESVIMESAHSAPQVLSDLRELGVDLIMDDFGTGHSSLSWLHRFPLEAIKIDRGFVLSEGSSRDSAAVVNAIITLAHNLSIKVTVEGIETPEQVTQFLDLGCDYGQGSFFSKPISPGEVTALLDQQFLSRESA